MLTWTTAALLAAVGFVSGALNVVAGGGSFLTLPILIFLGLPPTQANATNRVAVLIQSLGASWSFQRYRVLEWHRVMDAVIPVLAGAALGSWGALAVGDRGF